MGKYVASIKRISVCFLVVLPPWGKFYLEKKHGTRTGYWTFNKICVTKKYLLVLDWLFSSFIRLPLFSLLSFLNRQHLALVLESL